jgi:hypothetical protein
MPISTSELRNKVLKEGKSGGTKAQNTLASQDRPLARVLVLTITSLPSLEFIFQWLSTPGCHKEGYYMRPFRRIGKEMRVINLLKSIYATWTYTRALRILNRERSTPPHT